MSLEHARTVLESARTVAVLGAHPRAEKPAHYVPAYLVHNGYRVIPVNTRYAGRTLWDEPVRATLAELDAPVDVVDVFRRADAVPEHLDDILAMSPLPKVVWLQLGIRNDAVAERLRAAGIDVIQDRCMLADHGRLGLPPIGTTRGA